MEYKQIYKLYNEKTNINSFSDEKMFAERFFELTQNYFIPLYKKVSQPIWNNGIYMNLAKPYYTCYFCIGVAEHYIPTVLNSEGYMQFHRVVIAVLDELDEKSYEDEIQQLLKPLNRPMGLIDSTTIFVIAPKVTKEHAIKVWKEKKKGMLKIKRIKDALAIPIVSPCPEVAFKKLLSFIKNFWDKRVKAFLEKLKILPYMYDYDVRYLFSNTLKVIENYDSQITYCLKNMVAHLIYFMDGLKEALKAIGKLNIAKKRILDIADRLTQVLSIIEPEKREYTIAKLQECLTLIR